MSERLRVTTVVNWRGQRLTPGDLFPTDGMSVGQVASARRLFKLEPAPKKRKRKSKPAITLDDKLIGEKDE